MLIETAQHIPPNSPPIPASAWPTHCGRACRQSLQRVTGGRQRAGADRCARDLRGRRPKGAGKKGVLAEAPGICLVNPQTGSVGRYSSARKSPPPSVGTSPTSSSEYWAGMDIETASILAKEAKVRRKRLRPEARRRAARTPRAEPLDEFYERRRRRSTTSSQSY